jgi:hypothetical protein
MNFKLILAISVLLISGCKATNELEPVSKVKPGVAKEGSLANQKLISDATASLEKIVGDSINDSGTEILKFVIQQPVGEVGSRSWREMWIVKSPNNGIQFLITFKEAGTGTADFEIKQMGKKS